ncbi:MAG: hypothetical protein HY077_03195 [Elusimicrobia bacterium]|nr:hypothetical protein [Elusimicrobiota bacterium]
MKKLLARLEKAADWLDSDDPEEPAYDPVHFGTVLVVTLIAVGALYWLLWTLLVYEGGLPAKLSALAQLASGGNPGPDAFEGWLGNTAALILAAAAVAALHAIYRKAAAKK